MAGMLMGNLVRLYSAGGISLALLEVSGSMDHSTFFLLLVVASLLAFGVLMLLLRRLHGTISEPTDGKGVAASA